MQNKFTKPSLSTEDKERKAAAFLDFMDKKPTENIKAPERKMEKEETKNFSFRVPSSLFDDIREISALTGISINSICLELIRPSVKKKLKELRDGE
jgi:predicted HicB family RNase H-like nuclease